MPFKPIAKPEDYPERTQRRPSGWVTKHQENNLKRALGDPLWEYLEALERRKNKKCLERLYGSIRKQGGQILKSMLSFKRLLRFLSTGI